MLTLVSWILPRLLTHLRWQLAAHAETGCASAAGQLACEQLFSLPHAALVCTFAAALYIFSLCALQMEQLAANRQAAAWLQFSLGSKNASCGKRTEAQYACRPQTAAAPSSLTAWWQALCHGAQPAWPSCCSDAAIKPLACAARRWACWARWPAAAAGAAASVRCALGLPTGQAACGTTYSSSVLGCARAAIKPQRAARRWACCMRWPAAAAAAVGTAAFVRCRPSCNARAHPCDSAAL